MYLTVKHSLIDLFAKIDIFFGAKKCVYRAWEIQGEKPSSSLYLQVSPGNVLLFYCVVKVNLWGPDHLLQKKNSVPTIHFFQTDYK